MRIHPSSALRESLPAAIQQSIPTAVSGEGGRDGDGDLTTGSRQQSLAIQYYAPLLGERM